MMIRQLVRSNKRLLILFVFGIMTAMHSLAQKDIRSHLDIADNDTVYLEDPENGEMLFVKVTGSIYKAIDPRYIANVYGFKKTEKKTEYDREKITRKSFSITGFDYAPIPDFENWRNFITSLNASKKWNYYINDQLLYYYSRVLVSALI